MQVMIRYLSQYMQRPGLDSHLFIIQVQPQDQYTMNHALNKYIGSMCSLRPMPTMNNEPPVIYHLRVKRLMYSTPLLHTQQ